MSYIGTSRKDNNSPWEITVCLNIEDCKIIKDAVSKIAERNTKRYEKWLDILQGGEMTETQSTRMIHAEDDADRATTLEGDINFFIKNSNKEKP